ncbi:hypothetical protein HYS79_02330 [Patescibacteria group bacterium]|nr:hypothetical protein [Patescibacteria group bacterium]
MKNTIIAVLVVVVAAGAWWYYYGTSPALAPSIDTATVDGSQGGNSAMPVPGSSGVTEKEVINVDVSMAAQVALTANGFSPQTVTIKKGGAVTFVNESGSGMWVASAQHPTHTAYAGTSLGEHCDDAVDVSFDQCNIGDTYSFDFDKTGSFKYHNHANSSQFGTVVVVE